MLVIDGKKVPVPGVTSYCYLDDPTLAFTNPRDFSVRETTWVRSICVHTRLGKWPQKILPAAQVSPLSTRKFEPWYKKAIARVSKDDRFASWHISVHDNTFACHMDLARMKAFHASQVNDYSIGIEMFQDTDGSISNETLLTTIKVIDVLTAYFGIQRQVPKERTICKRLANGTKSLNKSKKLAYMEGGLSGYNFVGVWGHRNCTRNRGLGDPGDAIFDLLTLKGYEAFSFDVDEDLAVWRARQKILGVVQDGVPGPATVRALHAAGYKDGIWVP